jgi:hypothetical protein
MRLMMLATTAVCLCSLSAARAGEEKVSLDKLPRAVSDAVKKRFPSAELTKASKETEGGKTEYEVVIKDGGTKIDVIVDPSGVITAIEKTIAVGDLPKAVRAALDAKYAGATYHVAEEITKVKDGKEIFDCYEVVLTKSDKKKVEVQVGTDGRIKKEESEGEEK